jgi:hypothetical protein
VLLCFYWRQVVNLCTVSILKREMRGMICLPSSRHGICKYDILLYNLWVRPRVGLGYLGLEWLREGPEKGGVGCKEELAKL